MTCAFAKVMADGAETPLAAVAAVTPGLVIPPGSENVTILAAFGFDALSNFDTYLSQDAPPSYLDANAGYYGCLMSGSKILIAIFAMMSFGEGISMIGQPIQSLNVG